MQFELGTHPRMIPVQRTQLEQWSQMVPLIVCLTDACLFQLLASTGTRRPVIQANLLFVLHAPQPTCWPNLQFAPEDALFTSEGHDPE